MKHKDRLTDSVAERLVTVGEIAEIADVGSSAVSNWRKRHANFPLAVEKRPTGELFRLGQVVAWLEGVSKAVHLPDHSLARHLETQLWDWSNQLRGVLPPSEFLELPLQLLYIRRQSLAIETKKPGSLWQRILDAPPPELARAIHSTLAQLAAEQQNFALNPAHAIDRIESSTLHALVDLIGSCDLGSTASLGQVVSTLVEAFNRRVGQQANHFTPSGVRDLMIDVLSPIEGRVYDPAFGAALFLAAAWRAKQSDSTELYGQELNESSWRLGALHLALNDAPCDLGLPADTLARDQHLDLRAHRIALDPPFNVKLKHAGWLDRDPRWVFGPTGRSTDLAWAQHLLWHLDENGIGVMTCPAGALFRGGYEADIRRNLVEADVVDAVIQLPEGVLPMTSVPPVLLVFDKKRRNRAGRVLFVDARELGQPERGGIHELRREDIDQIILTLRAWRRGRLEPKPSFSGEASTSDMAKNDWNLSVQRYVTYLVESTEIEGEPIVDRFQRLREQLEAEIQASQISLASMDSELEGIGTADDLGEWPVLELGDLLVTPPVNGIGRSSVGAGPPIAFVETGEVSKGRPVLTSVPDEVTLKAPKDRLVKKGDLLLVSRGVDRDKPVGCAKIGFDTPATFANSLVRLRVNHERVLADYLRLFLTSRKGLMSLRAVATGTVITNLPKTGLLKVQVPVPDLGTQHRLVQVIRRVEQAMAEVDRLGESIHEQHDVLREGLVGGLLVAKQ